MYIGIDGNEANTENRVGVNQYAFELLWGMYRANNKKKLQNNFVIYLKNAPIASMPTANAGWNYRILEGNGLWVLTRLTPALVFDKKLDVFFSPHHYLPLLSASPKVMAIHDLGYLEFSEQFKKNDFWQLKYWTAISIYISKHIITFSQFTKKDIVRHYKSKLNEITVIHHGYNKDRFNTAIPTNLVRHIQQKYKTGGKYVLYLGTLKPSKNIERLIQAFRLVHDQYPDYRLVIAGRKGWLYKSIFNEVRLASLEDSVIFTDFVNEDDKPALIAGAKAFLIPSLWEGFGMDIVSSYACGVPVVGSDVASIPEIGGDIMIKCNPYSVESIAIGVVKVLKMSMKEYNSLRLKCLERASKFSWDLAAENTLDVLEKVAR